MKYSSVLATVLILLGSVSAADQQQQGGQQQQQQQGGAATLSQAATTASASGSAVKANLEYDAIEFENFGYDGYYYNVKEITNADSDECTCTLSTSKTKFSGSNAPINQELSVHFRGPLILSKFAWYTSEDYVINEDVSGNWSRGLYYDSSSSTAENVTFLTAAGTNSTCLGKALTYADSDGTSELSSSTVMAENTLINSDEEFIIFSNVSCGSSGYKKDCGVYRDGIPAYHGFYGDTKMFLFEFEMPSEDTVSTDTEYYDMPAIWLLNSNIPRTSQYPTNANCSCWASGCGEFDIFEVLNSSETNHMYSTIHDYQGTGDINDGLQAYGYIERETDLTMRGGVVFDSNGTAFVFLSNDTQFDSTIVGTDLQDWISNLTDTVEDKLSSVSSSGGNLFGISSNMLIIAMALNLLLFIL